MSSGVLRCGSIRQSCVHETSSKIPFPSLSLCFIGFNWEFRQWPRYHFFPDILVITSTVWYVLSEHSQHRGHQPPAEFTSPDLKLIYICVCVPACWRHTENFIHLTFAFLYSTVLHDTWSSHSYCCTGAPNFADKWGETTQAVMEKKIKCKGWGPRSLLLQNTECTEGLSTCFSFICCFFVVVVQLRYSFSKAVMAQVFIMLFIYYFY